MATRTRSAGRKSNEAGEKGATSHAFQAEVSKLLNLMVHSVYAEREVFLRELISNGADALDKLRYEAVTKPELLEGGAELKVTISTDKEKGTLVVADTGIGMDEQELIDNLGTIARSGTQAFAERAKAGEAAVNLIGQFGVGFYAAFMVAERVDVVSRRAGAKDAFLWSSDGTGSFTVEPHGSEDAPKRGTEVRLKLREDAREFLDDWRLEQIVRTYSDHVAHPIYLAIGSETARQINEASALWMRPRAEITADQYREFLAQLAGTHSSPALTLHYRAEGRHEYTVLLFVPGERPFDLYDPERRGRQKLYVRRVFITGDAELLPPYLRFVRGVVDSEDMPLNISREMLQNNPQVAQIRKAVTNRVLSELKKHAEAEPESYKTIWANFGCVLKEGLYEDPERRDQLFELARFRSTAGEEPVSLKDYVSRLKANQTAIYYLTAEDAARAAASPQLEGYRARGVEVLLLTDPVDSFWVRTALGFDGKPFKSVTQGTGDLDAIPLDGDGKVREAAADADTATLIAAMKQALGDAVQDVRRSKRLTDSPVCLVAPEEGFDRTLEKLLSRQATTGVQVTAPVLEINPGHPLIAALAKKAKAGGAIAEIEEAARLLLDQAHILDGDAPKDPRAFAERLTRVMGTAFGQS